MLSEIIAITFVLLFLFSLFNNWYVYTQPPSNNNIYSYLITIKKLIGFKDWNHYHYCLIEYPLLIFNEWTKRKEPDTVNLINGRKTIQVDYYHRGEKRSLFLPYSVTERSKWNGYKVFLVVRDRDDGEKQIEITHDPSFGYNFTPKMMGGIKAIIEKEDKQTVFLEDQYLATN